MKIQLSIINDKITVHYINEGQPYMESKYTNYENLSQEDKNRVDTMVDFFKDLKEEDVHLQSESNSSS